MESPLGVGCSFCPFTGTSPSLASCSVPSSETLLYLDLAVESVWWVSKPAFTEGGMVLTPLSQPDSGPAASGLRKPLSLSTVRSLICEMGTF